MGVNLFVDDFCDGCFGSSTASFGDITVSGNTIYNAGRTGINAWYGEAVFEVGATAQVSMGKSIVSANTVNGAAIGIALDIDDAWTAAGAAVAIGDQDILDNTVTNATQQGIHFEVDASNASPAGATLAVNRALISGNTVSGSGGSQRGVSLSGDIGSGVTFGTPQITGNVVGGFTAGIFLDEGSLYNGLAAANIRGNTVQNNVIGLQVNGAGSGYDAACNTLAGNSGWGLAVNDGFGAVVKAEHNWWGDAAGPAACAACNGVSQGNQGSVDFTPWLSVTPDKASRCRGGFPWPMFLPAITHPRP